MRDLFAELGRAGFVPVLTVEDPDAAEPLARALREGGLPAAEVTKRTDGWAEVVRRMKAAEPELAVGVGTILSAKDADQALEAGAEFLVAPGAPAPLLAALASSGVPAVAGASTLTEIMAAVDAGLTTLKFFPAEPSGRAFLHAVAPVLPEVRFIPTGGISREQAAGYLEEPNVLCIGASWVAPQDLLAAKDWGTVRANAESVVALRREART